jgi:hypothetical protein
MLSGILDPNLEHAMAAGQQQDLRSPPSAEGASGPSPKPPRLRKLTWIRRGDAHGSGLRNTLRSVGQNLWYGYHPENPNWQDEGVSAVHGWMVRARGEQYGPYDTDFLLWMVATEQIEADAALVWRQGMSYWEPLIAVRELSARMS